MNTIKTKNVIIILSLLLSLFANYIVLFTPVGNSEKISYNIIELKNKDINRGDILREEPVINYSQEDLYLLAKLIYCEAGSDWLSDEHQQLVAMVALNRVNSDKFPNTLKEVVYQKGQYACIYMDRWNEEPPQRCIDNAKLALEGQVYCPSNVLFQAEFKQGSGIYKSFKNEYADSTTYFCYY